MTDRRIFVGARTCAPDVIGFGGVQFEPASTMAGTGFSCYPPLGLTQHSLIRITRRARRNHTSSGLTEEEIITDQIRSSLASQIKQCTLCSAHTSNQLIIRVEKNEVG